MWNNGQGWQAYGDLNLRTWYQSDLVTITDQAMTKHYFIAGQRIASKLVESLVPEVSQNLKDKPVSPLSGDIRDLAEATATRLKRDFDCLGIDYNAFYPGETRLQALEILQSAPEVNEYQVFFYHQLAQLYHYFRYIMCRQQLCKLIHRLREIPVLLMSNCA